MAWGSWMMTRLVFDGYQSLMKLLDVASTLALEEHLRTFTRGFTVANAPSSHHLAS